MKNSAMIVEIKAPFNPIKWSRKNIVIKLSIVERIVILMYSRFFPKANINCFKANETPIKTGISNPNLKKELSLIISLGFILKNNKMFSAPK